MSYFTPYVDAAGLHIPTYSDIRDDIILQMKKIYGNDIYLENDSADYQFISTLALKISDSYQAVQYAYNSRSPATAIGAALDSIVKLNGIARKAPGYSTCQVTLTGIPFAEIKNGSVVDKTGLIWNLPSSVIIGSDGTVISSVVCQKVGAVSAEPGDIDKINTPTYGWKSVINHSAAIPGNVIETDAELRQRQTISVSNPSQTMLEGTHGALMALKNIARVAVYENDTNVSVVDPENNPHGLPPHSITCVVEGGSDTDIAKAILYHKGIGCYTNGSKEVSIIDRNDYVNKVRFYRPAYVDIYVNLKLKKYTGYVSSLSSTVKTAIYNYISSLEIGRDVSISMLTGAIMSCNPDITRPVFGISSITIGRSKGALANGDIDIKYNEVARPNYDNIEVTV
nr:MAG TPA: Baseplate J like protein [Caudoviricetes sp.]